MDVFLNNLKLEPGENRFHFYSPFPGTPVGNRQLAFVVRDDSLRAGRLRFNFAFDAYWQGDYALHTRPYGPESAIASAVAELDGRSVSFEKTLVLSEPVWTARLSLAPGEHKLSVSQEGAEQYFLRVVPDVRELSAAGDPAPIEPVEASPTKYRIRISVDSPGVLIFGESFDPRWTASADGKALRHLRINGFGNAYILPEAGDYDVTIYFQPQRLFEWGFRISLATVAILVALGSWTALRRRAWIKSGDLAGHGKP